MNAFFVIAALLLAGTGRAAAQTFPAPTLGDKSVVTTSLPGRVPLSLGTLLGDQISVRSYGAACNGTTDDSPALAAAAAALRNTGDQILVPGGCRLLLAGAAQPDLQGVSIIGRGVRELGAPGETAYGQQGSTILLTSASVAPILVGSDWNIRGINFFWPGQTEASAAANGGTPGTYPPLLTPDRSLTVENWSFEDNQVENAWDIANFSTATGGVGHAHWEHNKEFALDAHLILQSSGGEMWITGNQFTPEAYLYGVLGVTSFNLENWAANNATELRIVGPGTPTQQFSGAATGIAIADNYTFGLAYGIHAVGGTLNLATLTGNGFDGVGTVLQADNGGAINQVTVDGGNWLCTTLNSLGKATPCISIASTAAPGNRITISNVNVSPATAQGIIFDDTGTSRILPPQLTIIGGTWDSLGNENSGNPYHGIEFNAPGGTLTIEGTRISTHAANQTAAYGLVVDAATAVHVDDTVFDGWAVPIVINASSGSLVFDADASINSTAPAATAPILGAGASLVTQAGDAWDLGGGPTNLSGPGGGSVGSQTGDGIVGAPGVIPPTATAGFADLPVMAAAPTGTPARSATSPCVVNAASGYLDCYFAGSWHSAAFAAGAK